MVNVFISLNLNTFLYQIKNLNNLIIEIIEIKLIIKIGLNNSKEKLQYSVVVQQNGKLTLDKFKVYKVIKT